MTVGSSCNSIWGMLPNFTKPIHSQTPFSNRILTYWLFAICIWPLLSSKIVFLKVTHDFLITKFHVYFSLFFILNPLTAVVWLIIYFLKFLFTWRTLKSSNISSDISSCFSTGFTSFLYVFILRRNRHPPSFCPHFPSLLPWWFCLSQVFFRFLHENLRTTMFIWLWHQHSFHLFPPSAFLWLETW